MTQAVTGRTHVANALIAESPLRASQTIRDIPQAVSIKFNNLVYELRAAGHDIITLSLGEAFFELPPLRVEHLSTTTGVHHYSHSRGVMELRRRLATYCSDECGVATDPDTEIIVTAGSKVAIYMVLLAVLEPGDDVLMHEPCWLSYPEHVRLCGGCPVMVPHDVDVFDLARWVTARTRAIILNNPNNPTGRVYSASELRAVHDLAQQHGLLVLADEAYNEFTPSETSFVSCGALDRDKTHTVVVNSMSKNFGMSGWRVGYLVAHRTLIDQVLKINQHLITCAPTLLQCYLAANFDAILRVTRPQIQRVVGLRNTVASWLAEAGIDTLPGEATFYLFASLKNSTLSSTAFATRLLEESGVGVVPGIAYGASCDQYIRISVGTEPEERVRAGIEAVCRLIERTRRTHDSARAALTETCS